MSWPFHQHDSFTEKTRKKSKGRNHGYVQNSKKNVIGVIQRARDSQWKLGFIKEPLYTTQNGSTDHSASNKWTTSAFHVNGKCCST